MDNKEYYQLKYIINKFHNFYAFLFTDEEYKILVDNILEAMKNSNIIKDFNNVFIEYLNMYFSNYLNKYLKEPDKLLNITLNFIDKNIVLRSKYFYCVREVKKLTTFLSNINIFNDYYFFMELIENSSTLRDLLKIIVDNNRILTKCSRLDDVLDDEILLSLIDTYCILYNIDLDTSEYDFGSKLLNDSKHLYMQDLRDLTLPECSDEELLVKIKNGDKEARNILIEKYLNLVNKFAREYANRGMDFQDLIQEGNIGLIKAVDKYDASYGTKFSTYAYWWIKKAILDFLIIQVKGEKLPNRLSEIYDRFKILYEQLYYLYGTEPSIEEVASILKLSIDDVKYLFFVLKRNNSLDYLIDSNKLDNEQTLIDSNIDNIVDKRLLSNEISDLLNKANLTDKEKIVIVLEYGLCGKTPKKPMEIARLLNISNERVRQISVTALRKIIYTAEVEKLVSYTSEPEKSLDNLNLLRVLYKQSKNKYKRILIGKE